jgi:hypothetical protein
LTSTFNLQPSTWQALAKVQNKLDKKVQELEKFVAAMVPVDGLLAAEVDKEGKPIYDNGSFNEQGAFTLCLGSGCFSFSLGFAKSIGAT